MWLRNFSGSRMVTLRKGSWTLTSRPAPDDSMIDTLSSEATDRNMPAQGGVEVKVVFHGLLPLGFREREECPQDQPY